jgi:hypothetical protein
LTDVDIEATLKRSTNRLVELIRELARSPWFPERPSRLPAVFRLSVMAVACWQGAPTGHADDQETRLVPPMSVRDLVGRALICD